MSNIACLMENIVAATGGALIAIYVLLGLVGAVGLVTIWRLVVLAKMGGGKSEPKEKAEEKKKEAPVAAPAPIVEEKAEEPLPQVDCEDCEKVNELQERVVYLENRVQELENAPKPEPAIVYVEKESEPKPEPEIVYVEKERTLAESLSVAREAGKHNITKKSIIAYLSDKYGEDVELIGRGQKTGNGKLPLSDNHFITTTDGVRTCFTYVYETEEGGVVSLVRLDEKYAALLAEKHPDVSLSRFPKNKAGDWYSVVADDTFDEASYYAVFDASILYLKGEEKEEAQPVELEERTLKESLVAASEAGKHNITKKSIIAYLSDKYGDTVELIGRGQKTGNGKLPLSDNHFVTAADGTRTCFTYVYETQEGGVVALVRLDAKYVDDLAEKHPDVGLSRFPKNKAGDWYSVVADDTFDETSYYAVFDASIRYLRGDVTDEPEPMEEISLKESLAVAEEIGAVGLVSKKSIIKHLSETFGERVELNGRKNRTDNGKLLVSDNHFALGKKRVCFTYVYEDEEGKVTILVKTSLAYADALRDAHGAAVHHSPFPKNKDKDWYNVVVDGSFTERQVYAFLDDAARLALGESVVYEERTLKESLIAASEAGKSTITKKSIISYLSDKYGDDAELVGRGQKTGNGKLPLSDNHFITAADGKRTCFAYVYETEEGGVLSLVRLDAKYAEYLAEKHPDVCTSRFPKNKAGDWYSVVADSTFGDVAYYGIFDASIRYLKGEAAEDTAPMEEITLKESLAVAEEIGAVGLVSKKSIIKHLSETFGERVELNGRKNRTDNGKLLVSDNHFALGKKRVCFTYVYEDEEGKVTILVKTSLAYADALHDAHGAAVHHSPFPKNKEKDWYSVVIDGSFTEKQVYAFLDDAVRLVLEDATPLAEVAVTAVEEVPAEEAPVVEESPAEEAPAEETPVEEAPAAETPIEEQPVEIEELTLKEAIEEAKEVGATDVVSKKSIVSYLDRKYGKDLELHPRKIRTDNGKLLVSDNHFALGEGKRVCFTYIYQDEEGKVVILLRASEEEGQSLAVAHEERIHHSAFPKNKDKDWYSVVVDDSFTAKDVYAMLDRSIKYVLNK